MGDASYNICQELFVVKFKDRNGNDLDWTVEGMSEPGLYPIVSVNCDWYVDKGRLHPMLKLTRNQLPLMPAFAMTAHAAQGQTFSNGAIVDMRLGGSSTAMASYVAITRVERREDLLIYRPFPRTLYAWTKTRSETAHACVARRIYKLG